MPAPVVAPAKLHFMTTPGKISKLVSEVHGVVETKVNVQLLSYVLVKYII